MVGQCSLNLILIMTGKCSYHPLSMKLLFPANEDHNRKKNIAENTVEINRDPIIGIQEPVDAFITKQPNLRLREH